VPVATVGDLVNTAAAANAATTNVLTLSGDFSAAATAGSVTFAANAGPLNSTATAITAGVATVPLAAGTLAGGFVSGDAVYTLNGTTSLLSSAYTAALRTAPVSTAYLATTYGPITSGSIVRDGVQFESPWVTSTPGFISRIFVTQTTPTDVPYTVTVRNGAGLVTGGSAGGTLPSNRLTRLDLSTLLPADTTAFPGPYQVTLNVAATAEVTTGSYVLTTPNGAVTSVPLYRASNR
jgi:hypothetical protein